MSSKQQTRSLSLIVVGLSACCGAVAQTPLVWRTNDAATIVPAHAAAPRSDVSQLSDDVRAAVERAHTHAAALITSAEFQRRVTMLANVHVAPGGATTTGAALLATYSQVEDGPDIVCYHGSGGGGGTMAVTGFGACRNSETSPASAATGIVPVITLYALTLRRLASPVADTYACGLNTLAHEWAHRITVDHRHSKLTDDGHEDHATPVASYVIGALTQCLYLRQHYLGLADHQGARFALEACVEAVGTNTFFSGVCDAGWGENFVLAPAGALLW